MILHLYHCNSLLSLPFTTSTPPLNWSSIDCCLWEGISCNQNGQVIQIWLPSKGLQGTISPFLANLTTLSHLNLSHNTPSGSLPTGFFSTLNQFKVLALSYNYLAGDISSLVSSNGSSSVRRLNNLNLSHNSFSGLLPLSLYIHSPSLRLLNLSFNHHNGQIPSGLGECSKLELFQASFNSLSRPLPRDIYSATKLQEISLPSNNLSRLIRDEIINLTKLTKLELYRNQLSGKLPGSLGNLSHLKHIFLYKNSFIGALRPSLMNCTNLINLDLALNFFEGDISTLNFSNLRKLTVINLLRNDFTGNFPTGNYLCKCLRAIRLAENRLEGEIQTDVVQLKFLSFISLGYCRLTNITRAIKILMRCKARNILNLLGNFLHKAMSSDQSIVGSNGFENLRLLSLTGCQLTGQLSIWLSKIKNLEVLYLNSNRITGSIHGWLSSLPMLFWLHLCDNLISGEFPKELCSLPTLVSPTPLADNTSLDLPIYATVPSSLVEFSFLFKLGRTIVVSNNSLSGHIPIEIRHLKNLQALRLDHNKLLGKIPDQMSNLTDLEMLDLSKNHLFGEIPVSLANLHFLYEFSVVNNNLQGLIPSGTQLQSFDASAYEGNPGLCGPPLPNQGPHITVNKDDTDIQHEENEHSIPWLHISVVLGFITRFWGVCGSLVVNNHWRFVYF